MSQRMRQSGAAITTSESLIFQLMGMFDLPSVSARIQTRITGDASHPKFKAISGIIKAEKDNTKKTLEALPWLKPSALL